MKVEFDSINAFLQNIYKVTMTELQSPLFHAQIAAIVVSLVISLLASFALKRIFKGKTDHVKGNKLYTQARTYLLPIIFILSLSLAEGLTELTSVDAWLISIVQTLVVLVLVNRIIISCIKSVPKQKAAQILIMPMTFLFFMGWLDNISLFLSNYQFTVGNITVSLNGLVKTTIFGILLFWLGKASNVKGQSLIRMQKGLDSRSKELFAKLFEISLYILIFILLLEIAGIDITTLAIFGGALGLGLGFGLQSIASNFISGIIILLDKSLSVGDYIEIEDGQKGIVRELNMRSATVETFEGKDILVPNEKFISSTFINWTHQNAKQRYSLELQVSYQTDLHFLFELIRKVVSTHPKVLSGDAYPVEEWPDAEISSFGDSGVNVLIEFWMEGIDDGKNRVGADLLLMLWDAFKEHHIEIPYPQREVKILNQAAEQSG